MRELIEKRVEGLKVEYEMGAKKMEELGQQTAALREILLRISGAIIAMEELLKEVGKEEEDTAACSCGEKSEE